MDKTLARDAQVRQDVVDEIEYDPAVKVNDIAVVVRNGAVSLTGVADTYGTWLAAGIAAWRVCGVRDVDNQIIVNPTMLGMPTDAEMEADIRERVENSFLVPKGRVTVAVHDGVVTLGGTVNLHLQREAAFEEAKFARGVRDVANLITVDRSAPSPKNIAAEIRKALLRSAQLDAEDIQVAADGGVVTLTGNVRSYAERREAEDAAWRANGTTRVINVLTIGSH